MAHPLERVSQDVKEEAGDLGDVFLRWGGRSIGRSFLIEAARDSRRYSLATEKPWLKKETNMIAASISQLAFPLTTGIHQSSLSEIPVLGGLLQVGTLGMDMAANVGGITLPIVGWLGRAGWHGLTALVAEALPDRKETPNARHPRRRLR